MAVYDGARYLRAAVESILEQSLADLEFVIVDDGSTDETPQILASYKDPRLVRVVNSQNVGLTRSLNRAIQASSGHYLARQDADDWSQPERLAQQVAYLEAHADIGLLGTASRWIDDTGAVLHEWCPETDPVRIQKTLLHSIPFLHGTFLFRRACLADLGMGYDESMPVAQDCDLLLRLSERWEVSNLPEILYVHRQHAATVTARRSADQQLCLARAQRAAMARRLRYGWTRLGLSRHPTPAWVSTSDRHWLAQRYVWWSVSARRSRNAAAVPLLLIAVLLDPSAPALRPYVHTVLMGKRREAGP
jgi:glycosyltransferase involved in cell wall biosynthesis